VRKRLLPWSLCLSVDFHCFRSCRLSGNDDIEVLPPNVYVDLLVLMVKHETIEVEVI